MQDNILFFYTPSEILQKNLRQNEKVRLGGLVEESSVKRNDTKINFIITDLKKTMKVTKNQLKTFKNTQKKKQ